MIQRVQYVHDTSSKAPNTITSFFHGGKCLDKKPSSVSPKDWTRTQTGISESGGLQVWCNRCGINVTTITARVA